MRLTLEEVLEQVYRGLEDPEFQEALRRAVSNAEGKHLEKLRSHPYLSALARQVREAKEEVINNIDTYVRKTMESLRRVKATPYLAETASEAREIVYRIVGGEGPVVMSKSMVAEEVGLRDYLSSRGVEIWETDLGQLLVQLEHGKPMHTTAPAIHLTVDRAARLVRDRLGVDLPPKPRPEDIVAAVRVFLREKFVRAKAGISGANAIAADTGAVVLVENEGNIRLVTGLPEKHIVIAGIDKILPNLDIALAEALVQAAYAGLYPPTYIDVIAGPSNTADIEHHRVYGAHGPRELHVVLVDNGRLNAARDPDLRDQLRCIRCGRCQWECPVWQQTANLWGGPVYGGPMGVLWTAITLGKEAGAGLAMLCLNCGRCDAVCPVEIPLSRLIRNLKKYYAEK
ncbi:MAG: lactate utilization protein [Desulfurococcales archaeon]|nr:lactate utilization protein [Desulfurococcales archaeon]